METIKNIERGGERPFYKSEHLTLENVRITEGESALKECSDIHCLNCRFEGKYPLWEVLGFEVRNCLFTAEARSALWYSSNLKMEDSRIEAPKMFREMRNLELENVELTDADETFWRCDKIKLKNVSLHEGTYPFMNSRNIFIDGLRSDSKYIFQYVRDVEIHNAHIETKDAFWEVDNVTVYDSFIDSEYLGWYSRRLKLIRCHIAGSQTLCYAKNLILEDCTFAPDAELVFEYSDVQANIKGDVLSIKNPTSGNIVADNIGTIILDEHCKAPANCIITERNKR